MPHTRKIPLFVSEKKKAKTIKEIEKYNWNKVEVKKAISKLQKT